MIYGALLCLLGYVLLTKIIRILKMVIILETGECVLKVLCYGDSNTYGYDPRSYFGDRYSKSHRWVDILESLSDWTIVNDGLNGREIPNYKVQLDSEYDMIIVMLGTNDLLKGRTLFEIEERMTSFLQELLSQTGDVVLIAPPKLQLGEWVPNLELVAISERLGEVYLRISNTLGIRYIDSTLWGIELSYDGVHFSEKGHITFANRLYSFLMGGK